MNGYRMLSDNFSGAAACCFKSCNVYQEMSYFLVFILCVSLFKISQSDNLPRGDANVKTLFDFNNNDEASWQIVNDGVMRGRSRGFVDIKDGVLRFTGMLVTQGGGFSSVRTDQFLNLEGYAGLELRVRGNGRTFAMGLSDGTRLGRRTVSRRATFKTSEEWVWVRVPFSTLQSTIFGRRVDVAPVNLTEIERIGLYILDGQDGAFRLEVDMIRAYRDG